MNDEQAKAIRSGYRTAGVLLFVGFATIGFTRIEDRAIIGVPGSPANAMAAVALTPAGDDSGETYADAPDGFISMGNASRVPGNRIRRVMRERDVPVVASRQILAPGGANAALVPGPSNDSGTSGAIGQVLTPIAATPGSLASLAPPLGNAGVPIFAANVLPNGGGGGGGGGGSNPGDGGGTTPGNGGGSTPVDPVSPVPEPGTWAMLILGLFGIGSALRRKSSRSAVAGLRPC